MSELWDIYTQDRCLTGLTHQRGVPLPEGQFHLVVESWIFTLDGRVLLTQRAPQKPAPLLWECTTGSVLAGENSEQGSLRELEEEIGLRFEIGAGSCFFQYQTHDSLWDVWLYRSNVDLAALRLQEGEVVAAKLVNKEEFKSMHQQGQIVQKLDYIFRYW